MSPITPVIRAIGLATRLMFDLLKFGYDPSSVALPPDFEHLRPELLRIVESMLSASQRQCKRFNVTK